MLSTISLNLALVLGIVGAIVLALLTAHSLLLVEMIRQVAQLRHRMEIEDRPVAVSLGSAAGQSVEILLSADDRERLEAFAPEITAGDAVLLFLSTDCTTCRSVADGLPIIQRRHRKELEIVPIVDSRDDKRRAEFLSAAGLSNEDAVSDDGELARQLASLRARLW
jgi:hypothetical protein